MDQSLGILDVTAQVKLATAGMPGVREQRVPLKDATVIGALSLAMLASGLYAINYALNRFHNTVGIVIAMAVFIVVTKVGASLIAKWIEAAKLAAYIFNNVDDLKAATAHVVNFVVNEAQNNGIDVRVLDIDRICVDMSNIIMLNLRGRD